MRYVRIFMKTIDTIHRGQRAKLPLIENLEPDIGVRILEYHTDENGILVIDKFDFTHLSYYQNINKDTKNDTRN